MSHLTQSQRSGLNRRPRHIHNYTVVRDSTELAPGSEGFRATETRQDDRNPPRSRNHSAIRPLALGGGFAWGGR